MAKFYGIVILLSCLFGLISASAIPMWEYLSKDEKMAYLYNMFESQVDDVCKGSNQGECKKDLLKYGLKNLHDMPEDHLDTMDPYQRNANSLIWNSMMDGHQMMKKKSFTTSQPERDIYEQFPESNYLGSASSRQETVLNANGVYVNPTKAPNKHFGPMVIKVHLDGRPVQEEKSIPEDDDVHMYKIVKQRVPSLSSFDVRPTSNYVPTYKTNNPYPYAVYSRPVSAASGLSAASTVAAAPTAFRPYKR